MRFFEPAFVWFARLCASLVVCIPWLLGAVLGAATIVAMAAYSAPERYTALVPLAIATIGIGLIAALIGATAGTGLALLAHEVASAGTRRLLLTIVGILSSTPAVAVGVAMVGLLSYWHGFAGAGPFVPVTVAVAILVTPLAGRHALRELAKLPPDLRRAAAATGANPVSIAFNAIFPAARRGIAAAFLAAFAAAIGEATAAQVIFANVPDPSGGSTGPATLAAVVLAGGADGVDAVALAPACLVLLILGLIPVILSRSAERSAS